MVDYDFWKLGTYLKSQKLFTKIFNTEVPYAHILLMLPKSGIPTWECLFTNWENWEGKRWRNHLSATAPIAVLCNGFKNWRPLMKPKKRSKRSLLGLSYNTCQGKRLDTMSCQQDIEKKKMK